MATELISAAIIQLFCFIFLHHLDLSPRSLADPKFVSSESNNHGGNLSFDSTNVNSLRPPNSALVGLVWNSLIRKRDGFRHLFALYRRTKFYLLNVAGFREQVFC